MLARIAAFEARYLLRNPLLWCTALATFLLPFASLAFGLEMEEDIRVFRNSPWEIVSKYRIISCLFMFVTTAFVANAVLRDDDTGFGPILRSTGIRQGDYLFGRFLGAFGIAAACLALVSVGIWTGALVAGPDDDGIGPNRVADHLYGYFVIGLPNVLLTSAMFFALATATRSMMATYAGLLALLALYFVMLASLGGRPEIVSWLAIAEPFGARAFADATRYWTTPERNAAMPAFAGDLLSNRAAWIGVSLGTAGEELVTPGREPPVQLGHEGECRFGEDLLLPGQGFGVDDGQRGRRWSGHERSLPSASCEDEPACLAPGASLPGYGDLRPGSGRALLNSGY